MRPGLGHSMVHIPGNERVGVRGCEGPSEGRMGSGRKFAEGGKVSERSIDIRGS